MAEENKIIESINANSPKINYSWDGVTLATFDYFEFEDLKEKWMRDREIDQSFDVFGAIGEYIKSKAVASVDDSMFTKARILAWMSAYNQASDEIAKKSAWAVELAVIYGPTVLYLEPAMIQALWIGRHKAAALRRKMRMEEDVDVTKETIKGVYSTLYGEQYGDLIAFNAAAHAKAKAALAKMDQQ